MKKVLVTGKNSYIGTAVEKWLSKYPMFYSIDKISLKDDSWKTINFSEYDVIIHVAGIAHISTKSHMEDVYYKVNRDLTMELARKCKQDGVKQFIFTSSIIVYADSSMNKKVINSDIIPEPSNYYGKSKIEAEEGLRTLHDDDFKVAILRLPMVYGKGAKGNYYKLSKMAKILPVFPRFDNKRSMLHIDNLTEFIKKVIDNDDEGIFFPQNQEYVNTSELIKIICEVNGKKIKYTKLFNPIIRLLAPRITVISKVFGNLAYDTNMSRYKEDYQIRNLYESIELTER